MAAANAANAADAADAADGDDNDEMGRVWDEYFSYFGQSFVRNHNLCLRHHSAAYLFSIRCT